MSSSTFEFGPETGEIPVGQHDVEIVEAVASVNRNSGHQNLRITFEARDGSQLVDWWTKTSASRWRWEQLWSAAGLKFPVGGGTVDGKDLVGRRVNVEVIEDDYQGKTRLKVKDVAAFVGLDVPEPGDNTDAKGSFAAAAGIESDEEAPY
jgi:hypothetical protein